MDIMTIWEFLGHCQHLALEFAVIMIVHQVLAHSLFCDRLACSACSWDRNQEGLYKHFFEICDNNTEKHWPQGKRKLISGWKHLFGTNT